MKILYLGDDSIGSTCLHRADAFSRLGHDVTHVNLRKLIPPFNWMMSINVRTGFRLVQPLVGKHLFNCIGNNTYDLCWISCGCEIGPWLVKKLKTRCNEVVNYNHDDPFGTRDGRKWDLYRKSVPYFDTTIVIRDTNISEAFDAGARRVILSWRTYDSVAHAPFDDLNELVSWRNEVVFVGSWMEERGSFLLKLVEFGVPLVIFGDRWQKAPEWPLLKSFWRGEGLFGRDYVRALQGAKVAIGLLSRGNRDLHTTRSLETPFIGGAVFCGEDTSEHRALLRDGIDALFWKTADECASQCFKLLKHNEYRVKMASSARKRIMTCGLSNDSMIDSIIKIIQGQPGQNGFVKEHKRV